ncbi:hypothetical protein BDQ17DRAFT_483619 [Cyathus striatus]|nr:hypothetical protein BDQ17DRAFT_483619 [Cyathus striatus]
MQLNNVCQSMGLAVSNQRFYVGSGRYPTWLVIYYVNGIEYGRAQGSNIDGAAEIAASNAMANLRNQFPGYGF